MNTNLIHNILNLIGLILGVLLTFDWIQFGFSPETAAAIAGGVLLLQNLVKLLINVFRDGLSGMAKPQPPVQ